MNHTKWITTIKRGFSVFIMLLMLSIAMVANAADSPIQGVTAITEAFGDGQHVTAVVVEYAAAIDNASLSIDSFSVADQTVTAVYANSEPATTAEATNGKYVVIELLVELTTDLDNAAQGGGMAGNGPEGTPDPSAMPDNGADGGPGGSGGPTLGGGSDMTVTPVEVFVTQVGDILSVDGETYAASATVLTNDDQINLVADDFLNLEFTDPETGATLLYNLYVPENYDPGKSYPMVMFIHDAGVTSTEVKATLVQGLGAIVWAKPEEQARNESFVLAPQFPGTTVNDASEYTDDLEVAVHLIESLTNEYSIDTNRIYTTGQSMGCMSSIVLMINHPDLFAGALLVAGQWDVEAASVLTDQNLWIIVSEGDTKAYPGMNAITEALEAGGATISRATWNPTGSLDEITAEANAMMAEGSQINYTVLEGGSHRYTWQMAYNPEYAAVRDWLFDQTKAEG